LRAALADDVEDGVGDLVLLGAREFRVDRDGEHLACGLLGVGQIALLVPEVGKTLRRCSGTG